MKNILFLLSLTLITPFFAAEELEAENILLSGFSNEQTNLAGWILPLWKDKPWQMKYQMYDNNLPEPANDLNGNNWKDLAYDDSSWKTLTGPMGRSNGSSELENYVPTHNFSWDGDNHIFYLRHLLNLASIPSENAALHIRVHLKKSRRDEKNTGRGETPC